jgi:hypothetical protein
MHWGKKLVYLQLTNIFDEAAFHQSRFSSNGRHFIECTISLNFQNCKQNLCSTSTSKVINDLVRVTL